MGWHRMVIAAAFLCLVLVANPGCRSQPQWSPFCGPGTRVAPPPTGSYGSPNTYYQPGVQSVPATIPPTGVRSVTPSSQWSTVSEDDPKVASLNTATTSSSAGMRLKGMPVNTIRPPNEPAAFTPPDMMTELRSTMSGSSPVRAVVPASANEAVGESRSAVGSATWQPRSTSAAGTFRR